MDPTQSQLDARTAQANALAQTGTSYNPTAPIGSDALATPTPMATPQAPSVSKLDLTTIPINDVLQATTNAPSTLETQNTDYQNKLKALQDTLLGKSADQQTAEQTAGIPGLNDQLTSVTGNLRTLTAQQAALKQEENIIPSAIQTDFAGRGVTTGGVPPIQASRLRENQIKQATLTSQYLLTSAQHDNLIGDIANAEAKVKKAIDYKYAPMEQQLQYTKDAIDMNYKNLSREDQKRADAQKAVIDERTRQIGYAREDDKTTQGFIAQAIATAQKNNSQVPALIISRANEAKTPIEALQLLAPYLDDAQEKAKALAELAQTRAQTALIGANIGKVNAETAKTQREASGVGNGATLADYSEKTANGNQYINYDKLTTAEKNTVAAQARAAGIPLLKAGDVGKLNAIDETRDNFANIKASIEGLLSKQKGGNITKGLNNSLQAALGDKDVKSFNAYRTAIINSVQALAGGAGSGLRINQAEIDTAMQNDLPVVTGYKADTLASANEKIAKLGKQLDNWEKILVGSKGVNVSQDTSGSQNGIVMIGPDGKQYKVPQDQVAAFTAAGGHK